MRKYVASLLAAAGLVVLSGTAAARTNIDVGVTFGIPAPVYVAPRAPVYYHSAPVYSAPPVYVAPAPVYYGPPAYYAPPVYRERGWHRGWRHHHRHHRHHRHHGHHHR